MPVKNPKALNITRREKIRVKCGCGKPYEACKAAYQDSTRKGKTCFCPDCLSAIRRGLVIKMTAIRDKTNNRPTEFAAPCGRTIVRTRVEDRRCPYYWPCGEEQRGRVCLDATAKWDWPGFEIKRIGK